MLRPKRARIQAQVRKLEPLIATCRGSSWTSCAAERADASLGDRCQNEGPAR
jgi:hypothetical protein